MTRTFSHPDNGEANNLFVEQTASKAQESSLSTVLSDEPLLTD